MDGALHDWSGCQETDLFLQLSVEPLCLRGACEREQGDEQRAQRGACDVLGLHAALKLQLRRSSMPNAFRHLMGSASHCPLTRIVWYSLPSRYTRSDSSLAKTVILYSKFSRTDTSPKKCDSRYSLRDEVRHECSAACHGQKNAFQSGTSVVRCFALSNPAALRSRFLHRDSGARCE